MSKSRENQNFICALAKYRRAFKLTQEQLAQKLGVSRQTIIAIESLRKQPSLSLAFKIAKYFDADVEEIFSFK